jgi:hypothetical protein
MIQTSKHRIDKPSARLKAPDSGYWPSLDDPHDEWPLELLEIPVKAQPNTSKIGRLPELELQLLIRPAHRPRLKKKVRRKAA